MSISSRALENSVYLLTDFHVLQNRRQPRNWKIKWESLKNLSFPRFREQVRETPPGEPDGVPQVKEVFGECC